MPTYIDNASTGVYSQATAANQTVTTRDSNKDGVIDAVKFDGAAPAGLVADADGWIATDTQQGFEAVNQALQNMGLGIVSDGAGAEVIANLSEPLQFMFAEVTKSVASGLVLQSGSANNYADVQGQWADFISKTGISGELDVNALVQQVLREAYVQNTEDLNFYAQKVAHFNELKDKVRSQLTDARQLMSLQAGLPDDANITLVELNPQTMQPVANGDTWTSLTGRSMTDTPKKLEFDSTPTWDSAAGQYVPADGVEVGNGGFANKADLETYIADTEEFLNSVGDDSQLANVDMQNRLQVQQQTLQMMSNISKMLHDTAMAVIRKFG